MKSKSVQRRLRIQNPDYICAKCANEIGWTWPKGHIATMHIGICDVCCEEKSLSCSNDWLKPNDKILMEWD